MDASLVQLIFGVLLILGFVVHVFGQRTKVPRVTLLLLIGVLIGPILNIVPAEFEKYFPIVAQVALSIIGFMLGEEFLGKKLKKTGKIIISVAVAETLCACACVFIVLYMIGAPPVLALLLAGIAPASAPAATVDVIRESRASGHLTDTVLGVVAIDDMFGVVLFSFLIVAASTLFGNGADWALIASGFWEIGGGLIVGTLFALPMVLLSGRVYEGKLTLVEALGFVMACGGFAKFIDASYLIACITLGAIVANKSKHHERPFHAIDGISEPFLITFFILSGFEFDVSIVLSLGGIFVAYVFARSFGLIFGGALGARLLNAPQNVRRYVGLCLLPQAGVALGLGLVAADRFPEFGPKILSLLVASTLFFEILGPIATKKCLGLAGEAGQG